MKKITSLFLLIFISTLTQVKAQKLQTKWIQEFESKKTIIDVPLIDNDYVYIHLRDGTTPEKRGVDFLQVRKISDNELFKEIKIELIADDGDKLNYLDLIMNEKIIELNSELYIVCNKRNKSKKLWEIILFRLDKQTMKFKKHIKLAELPLTKSDINLDSFLSHYNDEIYLTIKAFLFGKKSILTTYKYNINKNGSLLNNLQLTQTIGHNKFIRKSETTVDKLKYNSELNCDNYLIKEYCSFLHQERENENNNYYSLIQKKDEKSSVYVSNYDFFLDQKTKNNIALFSRTPEGAFMIGAMPKKIKNCKTFNEFHFTTDKDDLLNIFKIGENYFFTKVNRSDIVQSKAMQHNTIAVEQTVTISSIEIACINNNGDFKWHKNINRESYTTTTSSKESFYQFKYGNKLILMYHNKYLTLDIISGDYKITDNNDFLLEEASEDKSGFQLILNNKNKATVFTSRKRGLKKIGVITFVD